MENTTFIPIFIYFFLPLLVLALYVRIIDRMKQEGVDNLPVFTLFIALFMYTMPVLFILGDLTCGWFISFFGLLSIILTGPIIMFLNAVALYNKREETTSHSWIYSASAAYIMYMLLLAIITYTIVAIKGMLQ